MGWWGGLKRKLLLHSLEKIKYLHNVIDVLSSSGESEGVLEFLFVLYLDAIYCEKVQKKQRLGDFVAVISIRLYAVRASD